jgi:hypothetical protein
VRASVFKACFREQLFGTPERRSEVDHGSSQATLLQVVIDVLEETVEFGLVDLPASVQQAQGVSDFEIVERRPRDATMLAKFPAGTRRVRFGDVHGNERARVEMTRPKGRGWPTWSATWRSARRRWQAAGRRCSGT